MFETELKRIVKPFDDRIIWSALSGEATLFDRDASWEPHHHGRPRSVPRGQSAFDGDAFLAGLSAIAFLATNLPIDDPHRVALTAFDRKISERLANPELLLYGGSEPQLLPSTVTKAVVLGKGYVYFRPATVTDADVATGVRLTKLFYPNATFPFSGLFPLIHRYRDDGFRRLVTRASQSRVAKGCYETDPRASVPDLVAEAMTTKDLSEDAATLYLQLLSLCDVSDRLVREVNGWKPAQHKRAIAELAAAELVETEKKSRARRSASISGRWEALFSPHPPMEHWKLRFYDARMEGKAIAAPLGRILPLRPVHETFAATWDASREGLAPDTRKNDASQRDWLAEIAAAPDSDENRLVYADYLIERGDRRGELITLQTRRLRLARLAPSAELDELIAAEEKLRAAHEHSWVDAIHPIVDSFGWDRGFISSVGIHAKSFLKDAETLFEMLPLLREVVMTSGRRNHIRDFVASEHFSRITQLDFTPDHYLRESADLAALLNGEHFPELEWLRIGFHRAGEGVGSKAGELLASCQKLEKLRFLEVAGQNLGVNGALAILDSKVLNALEVLRLPINDIQSKGALALLSRIRAGALPSLRVLDLGNVVETDFVPKAVLWFRNRVARAVQNDIVRTLGERESSAHDYGSDPVEEVRGPISKPVAQGPAFPIAAIAKSARSNCIVCAVAIAKGSIRIGIERDHETAGRITAWLHADCRAECTELSELDDVDERLERNSRGLWPPGTTS